MTDESVSRRPLVSYYGLTRAVPLVDEQASYYLRYYGFGRDRLGTYFPILLLVEGLLLQADEELERAQRGELPAEGIAPWSRRVPAVVALLRELGLYHPRIEAELERMGQFWELEARLLRAAAAPRHEEVLRAAELRTSDARALHGIIARLAGQPIDEAFFDLLWPMEVIVDLEQDLREYADDERQGLYNTYRMFVRLYGREAPARLDAELRRYRDLFAQRLTAAPAAMQERVMQQLVAFQGDYPSPPIPEPILP